MKIRVDVYHVRSEHSDYSFQEHDDLWRERKHKYRRVASGTVDLSTWGGVEGLLEEVHGSTQGGINGVRSVKRKTSNGKVWVVHVPEMRSTTVGDVILVRNEKEVGVAYQIDWEGFTQIGTDESPVPSIEGRETVDTEYRSNSLSPK